MGEEEEDEVYDHSGRPSDDEEPQSQGRLELKPPIVGNGIPLKNLNDKMEE
jgi:hypothetical protein